MSTAPRFVFQQGDHVCSLFTDPEEQLTAAAEYIRGGLSRGERCLYVCCEHELEDFRKALQARGIEVAKEEARGALVLLTKQDGHLKGGDFDPDRMIDMLKQAVEETLEAGFNGLCAAGDMTWLLDGAPGSHRLAEYEARLNHFYESHRALGLCLYNLKKLPPGTIDDCMATHRLIRIEGPIILTNPFYEVPELAAKRTADPESAGKKVEWVRAQPAA